MSLLDKAKDLLTFKVKEADVQVLAFTLRMVTTILYAR